MPKTVRLPDLPSALIRLALNDFLEVQRMPTQYHIDMGVWHVPERFFTSEEAEHSPPVICTVCLAGSVMARTLAVSPYTMISAQSSRWTTDTSDKLVALDYFRQGKIAAAFDILDLDLACDVPGDVSMCPYERDANEWLRDMQQMATMLEERGL